MITRQEYDDARRFAWDLVRQSGIAVQDADFENLEVADLGLSELPVTGAQILTLASTQFLGVKALVLCPNQFFPQHRHPPLGDYPGKQEIFRVQWGEAYLYLPGDPESRPRANPPSHRKSFCTVWHEAILRPGGQLICPPNTWHWFQAGTQGAVIWSFSSQVTDAQDQFADPQVVRKTVIADT